MAVKLGNGNWAVKEDKLLAYNDNSGRFFNKEFDFDRGSIATYVAKDGLIKSAASDVPRIDFSDSTKGALLLEPQSTNLLPYSEDFSHNTWTDIDVSLESGYLAPDGTNNAYKVTSTSTSSHLYAAGDYAQIRHKSIYARTLSGTGTISLCNRNSDPNSLFTITEQWQRFDISHSDTNLFYAVDFRAAAATLSEVIIWGGQLEQGSYATSYIPSLSGSATTRSADACNNSGSAQDFNSEEGVLYAEIKTLSQTGTFRQINLSNGTASSRIYISKRADSGTLEFRMENALGSLNFGFNVDTTSNFVKVAFRYGVNNFAVFINGVSKNVSPTGNTFSSGTLNNLEFSSPLNQPFFGNVKNLQVFTTALTDEQLAALTTI